MITIAIVVLLGGIIAFCSENRMGHITHTVLQNAELLHVQQVLLGFKRLIK